MLNQGKRPLECAGNTPAAQEAIFHFVFRFLCLRKRVSIPQCRSQVRGNRIRGFK